MWTWERTSTIRDVDDEERVIGGRQTDASCRSAYVIDLIDEVSWIVLASWTDLAPLMDGAASTESIVWIEANVGPAAAPALLVAASHDFGDAIFDVCASGVWPMPSPDESLRATCATGPCGPKPLGRVRRGTCTVSSAARMR